MEYLDTVGCNCSAESWRAARQGGRAWFAAEEEASHSEGVVPPNGLNLLSGGPANRFLSAIAPCILRKQEKDRLCNLSS